MNLFNLPVTMKDIREAQDVLQGKIYKPGMPKSNYLSECCKGDIFVKFENMQRTGSFKMRGAYNKLNSLTQEERAKGVVACSAGNHAQGVALSARMLGIDAKIVMPTKAPQSKVNATKGYGAEVVLFGDNFNDTMGKAKEIIEEEGRVFIHPYDDKHVIAGQGTIGLEILESLGDVDNVIVPIGGGGLISGVAVALKSFNPNINIIGVQAENVHGMAASIAGNKIVTHRITGTVADGCDVSTPGNLTYQIVKELVTDIVTVSEDDITTSMVALIQRNKIISEGAGALATAALLSGKIDKYVQGKKTVNIISGGNIDLTRISQILDSYNK
ncbi:bifunctional threonine ammonia-lyase/L-serine ammonia-lyase TdcB [Orbaceae bacterium ac157xtp]